jgi:hypothetical protein
MTTSRRGILTDTTASALSLPAETFDLVRAVTGGGSGIATPCCRRSWSTTTP